MRKRRHFLESVLLHNEFKYFITVTLRVVYDNSYERIKKFFRSNDFGKYVIVPELSPNNKRLHFHILTEKQPYEVINKKIRRFGRWEEIRLVKYLTKVYGITEVQDIKYSFSTPEYIQTIKYLSKYLGKDLTLKNTYSRGLKKFFTLEDIKDFHPVNWANIIIELPSLINDYEDIEGEL